jgi:hypothetical protein
MEDLIKPIAGGAIGFFGTSLLHTYGLSNIAQLKPYPEISDVIVIGAGVVVRKKSPTWGTYIVAGAGISLLDHILTRIGVRI